MYRDLRKGAPVEADHILGDFIERGSERGIVTQLLKASFVNLRVYQAGLPKR
jgi:2-dehydropantoate 2-reductase